MARSVRKAVQGRGNTHPRLQIRLEFEINIGAQCSNTGAVAFSLSVYRGEGTSRGSLER